MHFEGMGTFFDARLTNVKGNMNCKKSGGFASAFCFVYHRRCRYTSMTSLAKAPVPASPALSMFSVMLTPPA